ncbi:Rho termination factor [Striga asiatica]|uniref:Rho termination factor n=1 Tax=Striga asiatica TaxID=4170 RepID=A0A5A7R736_STRAF|nr:Rho termination factor [Striga asiatica]
MGYDYGDNQTCNYYFGFGRDVVEEDILNEKSCVQVLRIWIDKADDEIKKLEEDIIMIKCQQQLWHDEDWSRTCSAALREKIDHLNILIESGKREITEDLSSLEFQIKQPENVAERLCDLVKPLLENHLLGKSKKIQENVFGKNVVPTKPSADTLNDNNRAKTLSIFRHGPQKKCKAAQKTESSCAENSTGHENFRVRKKESTVNDATSDCAVEKFDEKKDLLLPIKDTERLKLNDLKIIAKNQKLPGYYKLRKKELLERLGLEGPTCLQKNANEKKRISPANTV